MTIKVYTTDGKVEEFPNAHIAWDWDDDENGTDSGYRIHSMDKQFTSVQAFVYPCECKKIEIVPEDSDKIFKRTPREGAITGKRFSIFAAIDRERNRQDEKWGEQNHPMLFDPHTFVEEWLETFRDNNNNPIYKKTWFSILMEEVCEAFIEKSTKRQRDEMIQVSAVAVAIIEYLDRKNQSTSGKQALQGVNG